MQHSLRSVYLRAAVLVLFVFQSPTLFDASQQSEFAWADLPGRLSATELSSELVRMAAVVDATIER